MTDVETEAPRCRSAHTVNTRSAHTVNTGVRADEKPLTWALVLYMSQSFLTLDFTGLTTMRWGRSGKDQTRVEPFVKSQN